MPNDILNEAQAAKYLGVSHGWLMKMRKSGLGPRSSKIRQVSCYLIQDLDAFRANSRLPLPTKGRNALSVHCVAYKLLKSMNPAQVEELFRIFTPEQQAQYDMLYKLLEYHETMRSMRPKRVRTRPTSGTLSEG